MLIIGLKPTELEWDPVVRFCEHSGPSGIYSLNKRSANVRLNYKVSECRG